MFLIALALELTFVASFEDQGFFLVLILTLFNFNKGYKQTDEKMYARVSDCKGIISVE